MAVWMGLGLSPLAVDAEGERRQVGRCPLVAVAESWLGLVVGAGVCCRRRLAGSHVAVSSL